MNFTSPWLFEWNPVVSTKKLLISKPCVCFSNFLTLLQNACLFHRWFLHWTQISFRQANWSRYSHWVLHSENGVDERAIGSSMPNLLILAIATTHVCWWKSITFLDKWSRFPLISLLKWFFSIFDGIQCGLYRVHQKIFCHNFMS